MESRKILYYLLTIPVSLILFYISYWEMSIFGKIVSRVSIPLTGQILQLAGTLLTISAGILVFPLTRKYIEKKTGYHIPLWVSIPLGILVAGVSIYLTINTVSQAAVTYAASQ